MSSLITKGFTLLELILVLAIIAIGAAFVIPRISGGQVTLLQAQVREAVAALNYARRTAIVQGKPISATFHNSTDTPAPGQPSDASKGGVNIQWSKNESEDKQGTPRVTFYPEGGSNGGEIIFTYQEYKMKVIINPITGKITSGFLDELEEAAKKDSL